MELKRNKMNKEQINEKLKEEVGIDSMGLSTMLANISSSDSYDDYIKTLMSDSTIQFEYPTYTESDTFDYKTKLKIVNKSQFQEEGYPCYAKPGDSGFDLKADITEDIVLQPLERALIPTGIYVDLPEWCEIQVRPKSGLSMNTGLVPFWGTGDAGYVGEYKVGLFNLSNETQTIVKGQKIGQCVLANVLNSNFVDLVIVDKIEKETERGTGGFGHTGKF
jgi:dUTP pyrophosphatase